MPRERTSRFQGDTCQSSVSRILDSTCPACQPKEEGYEEDGDTVGGVGVQPEEPDADVILAEILADNKQESSSVIHSRRALRRRPCGRIRSVAFGTCRATGS